MEAFAAACVALAVCSAVFIAAFEVACAVFTDFCVVFTVPLAAVFTVFLPLRAVCFIVFSVCCAPLTALSAERLMVTLFDIKAFQLFFTAPATNRIFIVARKLSYLLNRHNIWVVF